ncbi:NAD(P)-dependent oxidoreductase [Thalassolituus alkanivorans]|uniref:NAD(P)-dependent oxidoreductase n=1 Tax=Thalassolituus alkanivorans TaxID=2881055 RepID=UPI001E367192|nr:NAD(P)-dependent oxidoreductase [Thalassolituus alkanivorans]MCB2388403.1 NAD(P)-dependent oxidoreductase [Thalassolituus alkanivorans]MCB2423879.1 NAD(P)-dependent oxidoreductase [Thalassolituus alkanivorans]
MKLAIIGATGWIGSTLVAEAQSRGHDAIAIARDSSNIAATGVEKRSLDLTAGDSASIAAAVAGADLVIASIGGRAAGNHEIVAASAQRLLSELPAAGVNRLLWVGGAGSLEVAPGVTLLSLPEFPQAYKDEATAQGEALAVFRNSHSAMNWTFISPAAEIFPGERSGNYRTGGDSLVSDAEGNSRISVQDYAVAMIDEAENNAHPKQRIGVAY